MVEVKRKDGESYESLLRRFSRKVQHSGVLIRARRNRFYDPPKSRMMLRVKALKRNELREEREEQKKLGKLSFQTFGAPRSFGGRR